MFGLTALSLLVAAKEDAIKIKNVCALGHSADRNYSGKTFKLPEYATSLELRHTWGSISCGPKHNTSCVDDEWGSYRKNGTLHGHIILVDSAGRIVERGTLDRKRGIMTFKFIKKGEYSVWYEEDFKGSQNTDNTGTSCFDVFYFQPEEIFRVALSTKAPKKEAPKQIVLPADTLLIEKPEGKACDGFRCDRGEQCCRRRFGLKLKYVCLKATEATEKDFPNCLSESNGHGPY